MLYLGLDPLVACADWLPNAAGLAHLLEHMAFKGTARIGALDFKRESAILDTLDEGARPSNDLTHPVEPAQPTA